MNFGERIKQLRIEKEWTQEYVALKLNISVGALSRYETGMYEPKSLDLIKDFATLFLVSTDYLLCKTDIRNSEKENNDILDLAKIGFTRENYTPPTEKQKQQIKTIIETILQDNKKENNGNK